MKDRYEVVLKNSSILLAEDDENLGESFKKVLHLYSDTVYKASNGEEAFDAYLKLQPDIVITDIKMPKLDGLELIKLIREKNKKVPIVVTSAYTDQKLLLESIKLSLIEYLIKPVRESDLTRVLTNCAKELLDNFQTNAIIKLKGNCSYDYDNKKFLTENKSIKLTAKEIELFELLIEHKGNLVTKQTIEDKLYIYEEAPPSALKNLVFKLRKKLNCDTIKTVGKLGYMID